MIEVPVLVKDALREGNTKKNYRFVVYNTEETEVDFTIDNNNLVKESVLIDERMCSESEIKFGLCEGTRLEFQCFGVQNITGRRIKAFIDVQYWDENNEEQWYPIILGWFTVDECSRQASTGIMKMSCYNKLLSDYLNVKANEILSSSFLDDKMVSMFDIMHTLLDDYQIEQEFSKMNVNTAIGPSVTSYFVIPTPYYIRYNNQKSPFNTYMKANYVTMFDSNPVYLVFTTLYTLLNPYTQTNAWYDYVIGKYNKDKYGNFEQLELNIKQLIMDIIDSAKLTNSGGTVITGSAFIDYLCANDYWTRIFSVELTSDMNHEYPAYGWYIRFSTVQYEYNKAHNINPKTNPYQNVRPLSEYYHTASDITALHGHSPRGIIRLPAYYGMQDTNDPDNHNRLLKYFFGGSFEGNRTTDGRRVTGHDYSYWDADDNVVTEPMPKAYYSNGSVYGGFSFIGRDSTPNNMFTMCGLFEDDLSDAEKISVQISQMPDFSLRDIVEAVYETSAQYGRLDRMNDFFAPVTLNNSRLLPADDLYPANDLYPNSMSERSNPAMYSKLWADEGNVRSFRYLIITYKGTEVQNNQTVEVEKVLQRTVNNDGTDDYNMSNNWLFKNLVWTDEDVGDYADAMVEKMRNITWFPFEMWCAGLPYIETGDELEINVNGHAYTSYVLRRNLKGIQNLQDEMINGTLDIF